MNIISFFLRIGLLVGAPVRRELSVTPYTGTISVSTDFSMTIGENRQVMNLPQGSENVYLTLTASGDADFVLSTTDGTCLVGYDCVFSTGGTTEISGMSIWFSGDSRRDPVVEEIVISPPTTEELVIYVQSWDSLEATFEASWNPTSLTVTTTASSDVVILEESETLEVADTALIIAEQEAEVHPSLATGVSGPTAHPTLEPSSHPSKDPTFNPTYTPTVSPSESEYVLGDIGVNACPTGYRTIVTVEECEAASIALGLTYNAQQYDGHAESVCNYCTGCNPMFTELHNKHGIKAHWICALSVNRRHLLGVPTSYAFHSAFFREYQRLRRSSRFQKM